MESEHFSNKELACRHCGVNLCTAELVNALEAFRALAGRPVTVDDAYRCPEHNASPAVGGVPNSEHVRGLAADVKVDGLNAQELYRLAIQVPAFLNGGIGVDQHKNYIHLDVRGHKARWIYAASGKALTQWDASLDAPQVVS